MWGEKGIAVIDCDETETFDIVYEALFCAGVIVTALPIVQTSSDFGRHIYVSVIDTPEGNYQLIKPTIGSGEFRYGNGAYCLVPPSIISNGGTYKLIQGNFSTIPIVNYSQIEHFLKSTETGLEEVPQIFHAKKKPSANAKRLMNGQIPEKYPSRSEAEIALMDSLTNSGFSRDEIYDLFQTYPCAGKFREKFDENPKAGDQYFEGTYQNALEFTTNNVSQGRQLAISALSWALDNPWPGRAGITDRDVFLAHAEIAYRSGEIMYGASARELSEIANVEYNTAAKSTKRLVDHGLIVFEKPSSGIYPAQYRLNIKNTFPQRGQLRECTRNVEHDSFSYFGLGKSSKQIVDALLRGPKTMQELVDETGRHVNTIKKHLKKMERISVDPSTGDIVRLVRRDGDHWFFCEGNDLDEIAYQLGVTGKMERRRQCHLEERRLFNRAIKLEKRKDQMKNTR